MVCSLLLLVGFFVCLVLVCFVLCFFSMLV